MSTQNVAGLIHEAYMAGRTAWERKEQRFINPYDLGSPYRKHWFEGWDAMERFEAAKGNK